MSLDAPATDPHLGSLTIHGDTGSFPSHAELVRTLLTAGRFATLTTITTVGHVEPGLPYASLVAYSVTADGSPLVCISELAEHTRNAHADRRAGMLVSGLPVDGESDPLDRPRASLVGRLEACEPDDATIAAHLALHPGAADYVGFPDFGWWRLRVTAARYVGGFGHMSWVTGDDLAAAEPDPVLVGSQPAVDHMNADHGDACADMVRWLAGVPTASAARVHSIDRHGITLYATVPAATGEATVVSARVAFAGGALASAADIRAAVVELTHRARAFAAAAGLGEATA